MRSKKHVANLFDTSLMVIDRRSHLIEAVPEIVFLNTKNILA